MSHTVFPGAGDQDRIATKPGHGPGTGGPSTSAVTGRSGSKSGSRSEPRGGSRDGSRSETEPITGRRRATGWPTETERFTDRAEAGRALGAAIANHVTIEWSDQDPGSRTRPLVLGLSRGGVVVASEIATAVDGDLDVVVVRKVGLPWQPACGVGAIADEGPVVFDHGALAGAGTVATALTPSVRMQRLEVRRQHYRYRGDRPAPSVAGRPVVIADDGLAPVTVARAAVRAVRAGGPSSIMYAAPVCAAESADWIGTEADTVVHLHSPRVFHALGLWYRDFPPVTDSDVADLLATTWGTPHVTTVG